MFYLLSFGATVINLARGRFLDEAALVARLHNSQLHGAAINVFETEPLCEVQPLRQASNTTPHSSALFDG